MGSIFKYLVTAECARSDQHERSQAASACENLEKVEPAGAKEEKEEKKASGPQKPRMKGSISTYCNSHSGPAAAHI